MDLYATTPYQLAVVTVPVSFILAARALSEGLRVSLTPTPRGEVAVTVHATAEQLQTLCEWCDKLVVLADKK